MKLKNTGSDDKRCLLQVEWIKDFVFSESSQISVKNTNTYARQFNDKNKHLCESHHIKCSAESILMNEIVRVD